MSLSLSNGELAERVASLCLIRTPRLSTRSPATWDSWALYLDPVATEIVHNKIVEKARDQIAKSDYICAIPHAGSPLAVHMQYRLKKPLICFNWDTREFRCDDRIKRGAKIFLVDTVINSGTSLSLALSQLRIIDGLFQGIATIALNDVYDKKYYHNDRQRYLDEGKIKYLYTFSELIKFLK